MRKVVMGLSGGMDSATLLGLLLSEGADVYCCHFQYGSKHNKYEEWAVSMLSSHYKKRYPGKVTNFTFDITNLFQHTTSNLLRSGGAIPEGHFEDESMKLTVVPGRNLIFSSIMAGLAETLKAQQIALGVHHGDHAIYPDCRADFILALEDVIFKSTDGTVGVIAPFLDSYKENIIATGIELDVPYILTRTCYMNQPIPCGVCGSCQERLGAFKKLGLSDPLSYREDE